MGEGSQEFAGRGAGGWLIWESFMESADGSPGIQVVPGDPLVVRVVVAFPLDKVFDPVVADARVKHFI